MHTQLALAMSEMPKQHQEKKGCDGQIINFCRKTCNERYCDQVAS